MLATQSDGRLERALHWTEGFGGRECPYLADHHGAVIWHGVHGAGQVVLGAVASTGPAASGGERAVLLGSDGRQEARRWAGGQRRAEPYRVRAGADTFQLYWGDLHRHSLVSRCTSGDEPSLEDFYRYAWDVNEYDFWAVTDHAENSTAYQWWSIQKIADLLHVPGRFVPLYGFEWTSADCGHQNVIYGDVARGAPIFSAFAEGSTTPDGLWRGLAEHPEFPAITIPHHPGSAMVHNDWDYHDPRYSRLVEVFQACRGNYESPACFRQYSDGTATGTFMIDGLLRGHRFGLIASSDHGHGASYVAVLAGSLSRRRLRGLCARRTCAATTRDVFVDLRLGPHLMGSEVEWAGPRPLRVHAAGYAELARVDMLRDGEVVHAVRGEPLLAAGELPGRPAGGVGQGGKSTRWDGRLTVRRSAAGARVRRARGGGHASRRGAGQHTTHSFGEPYGAQRGGVEVSVCGPADAMVYDRLRGPVRPDRAGRAGRAAGAGDRSCPTGGRTRGLPGELVLQPAVGALLGLGARELDVAFRGRRGRRRPRLLLRAGVPGGRRAGLVVADLGAAAGVVTGRGCLAGQGQQFAEHVGGDVRERALLALADPLRERDPEHGDRRTPPPGWPRVRRRRGRGARRRARWRGGELVQLAFLQRGVLVDHGLRGSGSRAGARPGRTTPRTAARRRRPRAA